MNDEEYLRIVVVGGRVFDAVGKFWGSSGEGLGKNVYKQPNSHAPEKDSTRNLHFVTKIKIALLKANRSPATSWFDICQ
jgi:hypothetical protein